MPSQILDLEFAVHVDNHGRELVMEELREHYGAGQPDVVGERVRLVISGRDGTNLNEFLLSQEREGRLTYGWGAVL